uniref:Uncharacterized protein n=1 Tax=Rhizophora mucronata TaxID=61149 RepID=A0A2P2QC41_RHIMU
MGEIGWCNSWRKQANSCRIRFSFVFPKKWGLVITPSGTKSVEHFCF